MERSEAINEIAGALAKAQGAILAAIKDGTNPGFARDGKPSKYATLNAVWEAARPALSANGIAVIQSPETRETGTVTVVTLLAHAGGQWMQNEITTKLGGATQQAIGLAITYMRRYALAAMVGVAPDDDDDGQAEAQPAKTAPKTPLFQVLDAEGREHVRPLSAGKAAAVIAALCKGQDFNTVIAVYEHNEVILDEIKKLVSIEDIVDAYAAALKARTAHEWQEKAKGLRKKIQEAPHPDDVDALQSDPLMDELKNVSEKAWAAVNEAADKRRAELAGTA